MQTPSAAKPKPKTIDVTVRFPLSDRKPFRESVSEDTLISTVREQAMAYFAVSGDAETAYYLASKTERLADDSTVGAAAEHGRDVKLTIVKELIQG